MEQDIGASAAPTGLSQAEPKVSALRASIPSAAVVLDEWCKARAAIISEKCGRHVTSGGRIYAPDYCALLGEHRAYMAMRSFIHGSRLASGIEARSDETPQAAQPEGRKPGGNAATPETSQSEGPTS